MRTRLSISLSRFLLASFLAGSVALAAETFSRTEDIIYGRKYGVALTLDLFKPEKPNGAAILFMVSGGFFRPKSRSIR
jgi:hypothetical protein